MTFEGVQLGSSLTGKQIFEIAPYFVLNFSLLIDQWPGITYKTS